MSLSSRTPITLAGIAASLIFVAMEVATNPWTLRAQAAEPATKAGDSNGPSAGRANPQSEIRNPKSASPAHAPVTIDYELKDPGAVSLAVYDANGRQVRTLATGVKQPAGKYSATWDGLDRYGQPQSPGEYTWKLLRTPGFKREFLADLGINPTWAPIGGWVGNHYGPSTVMCDEKDAFHVGGLSCEGVPTILKLSTDGKKELWRAMLPDGLVQMARINDIMYLLYNDATIWVISAQDGKQLYGDPKFRRYAADKIPLAKVLFTGDVRAGAKGSGIKADVSPMCMAAESDYLAIAYQNHDKIWFLSSWDGSQTGEANVVEPKGIAVARDGKIYVVSGRDVVRLDKDTGAVTKVVSDPQMTCPTRLAIDTVNNDLLVVQQGPTANHVRRYSLADGNLVAVYGRPEGRTFGVFNPMDWGSILDIAADHEGGFFTVENYPRRVAHFSGRGKLELVQQWFGGLAWGSLVELDPSDPNVAYWASGDKYLARGVVDYATHTWTMTHLYDLPPFFSYGNHGHVDMFPGFMGQSYWEVRHVGGQTYLVNNGLWSGEGVSVVRADEQENKLVPVARLGILHPTTDREHPPEWWKAAMAHAKYSPATYSPDHVGYAWCDLNHDGNVDIDEITLTSKPMAAGYSASQYYVDANWNVYRVLGSRGKTTADKAQGPAAWVVIPNEGKAGGPPVWNWDHAQPSKAAFVENELKTTPLDPVGIFKDSAGNVYEASRGAVAGDLAPLVWPNNAITTARVNKWNAAGLLEWSVGVHGDLKGRWKYDTGAIYAAIDQTVVPPGAFAHARGILGEVHDCIVVLDAVTPASVWTRDGLYAGAFTDGRADDNLPDWVYHDYFGDDNGNGQVFQAPNGDVFYGAMSGDGTPVFRIHGWDNWERQGGKATLAAKPPAARAKGDGLKGEYFPGEELKGKAALSRIDPDLWIGKMWGDHREVDAKRDWFKKDEAPALAKGDWSARWTGFIEPPLSEDYTFAVYTYGSGMAGSKVRLYIDGQLVVDEWDAIHTGKVTTFQRTRGTKSQPISLQAGKPVPVRLEYVNSGGDDSHLHLFWQSASLDLRHVPQSFLYSKP